MNENENLVPEQGAENVEQTTEESPKIYSEADFNAKLDGVLGKKIARTEAKIRKKYERKYGRLEDILNAGMGTQSVDEATDKLEKFYEGKGIKIDKKPEYTAKDIETLARGDADEIIRGGYEDVVDEVDRLTELGAEKMTAREKAVFKILAEHRQATEYGNELAKIGVTEDVYNSDDFKSFKSKFNSNTPIKDIYDIYAKTQPKKEIKTMGSMKNTAQDDGIKEYYTPEEAKRFTQEEINNNPALVAAIERSMRKWK